MDGLGEGAASGETAELTSENESEPHSRLINPPEPELYPSQNKTVFLLQDFVKVHSSHSMNQLRPELLCWPGVYLSLVSCWTPSDQLRFWCSVPESHGSGGRWSGSQSEVQPSQQMPSWPLT